MRRAVTNTIAVTESKNSGLVVRSDATLVTLGDTTKPEFLLSVTAIVLVTALLIRRVKGALLIGITYAAVAMHLLGITKDMIGAGDEPGSLQIVAASAVVSPESGLLGLDF